MNEDEDIWASYATGVTKLGEKEEPVLSKKAAALKLQKAATVRVSTKVPKLEEQSTDQWFEKLEEKEEEPEAILPEPPPPLPEPPIQPQPLDTRIERNMSLGDVMIEARLDLHGQTEQEAYETLLTFVQNQNGRGKRMLLVITGKSGVLKTNLPRWCNVAPFNQYIMAARTAVRHHGGDGAYYVLLHRKGR